MQPNREPSLQPYLHAVDAQGRSHRSVELPAQPPSQMSETYIMDLQKVAVLQEDTESKSNDSCKLSLACYLQNT